MTFPKVIKPSFALPRSNPRPPRRRGTEEQSRGLQPRTSPLPPRGARRGPGRYLPAAGRRLRSRGAHGFAGLGRPRWDTRVGQRRPEPVALQSQARAAVIGPACHVGGERASLPGKGNPLPAPWPACSGYRDKGTSGDLCLNEWSARQHALVARSGAHCLSPA